MKRRIWAQEIEDRVRSDAKKPQLDTSWSSGERESKMHCEYFELLEFKNIQYDVQKDGQLKLISQIYVRLRSLSYVSFLNWTLPTKMLPQLPKEDRKLQKYNPLRS